LGIKLKKVAKLKNSVVIKAIDNILVLDETTGDKSAMRKDY
jgi:hypothetical protein